MKILAHAHTTYSNDGELTAGELATLARTRGYDAVLLSDHFEDLAADSFQRLVEECRSVTTCLMIPGYERSWRGYHVLALGVEEWFDDAAIDVWAANVRRAGGLTAMAHPGRYAHDIPQDILAACDAIEVWNSKRGYDGSMGPHPSAYRLLGPDRWPLCGQDLHGTRHLTAVALKTATVGLDRQSILNTLHRGEYRMTNGMYAFDRELSVPARALLSLVHIIRGSAVKMAVRLVKRLRRTRPRRAAPEIPPMKG